MSILPWDNWFYHIDGKKKHLRQLHQQAQHLNTSVKAQIDRYNRDLKPLRTLSAQNASLLIIAQVTGYSDLEYKHYVQAVAALPDPVNGSVPMEVARLVTEVTGFGLIAKGLFNIGKLAVRGAIRSTAEIGADTIEAVTEGAAEAGIEGAGEAVAEGVAEVAVEGTLDAALAETGVGIVLAVGVDLLLGVFEGAAEAHKLDKQIAKVQRTVSKLRSLHASIQAKQATMNQLLEKQQTTFIGLMTDLAKIDSPGFTWPHAPAVGANAVFIAAQTRAIRQYGLLVRLRNTWAAATARTPNPERAAVIDHVLMTAPAEVTQATLERYWQVLARHSEGMHLSPAGDRAPQPREPQVKRVPHAPPAPAGMKMSTLADPSRLGPADSVPMLAWEGYTYWAYSYIDNRNSFGLVAFDARQQAVHTWQLRGSRYIYDIQVDTTARTVTLIGQSNQSVSISWDALAQFDGVR